VEVTDTTVWFIASC